MNMTSETEIVKGLIEFAVETKYQNIPGEVLAFTKGMVMKTVAGIIAGSAKPSGQKLALLIRNRGLPDDAGVIGCGFRSSLWEAVFLNAFLAHAAEMTDNYTVIPLMLSVAETLGLSGRTLLEAVTVGLEIHARVCFFQNKKMGVAFVAGPVAPAMAAGKVYGLTKGEMASTLGLAMPNIGGTYLNMGTDAHYFESAHYTLQAIIAVEMARQGLTGNPRLVTFLSDLLGKDNVVPEKITENLGTTWLICKHWIKKYPCCFRIQRYVDALLELQAEHHIPYEEIGAVTVDIGPSEEFCDRPEPQTEMDLQFSLQHVLGAVLLDGDVKLCHIEPTAIIDPRLKDASHKVETILHSEWPRDDVGAERSVPGRITIKTKNNQQFMKQRLNPVGSWPEDPLSAEQVRRLYEKFCQGILPENIIQRTGDAVAKLERLADLRELMDMLVFGRRD